MKRFVTIMGVVLCLAEGHAQDINRKNAHQALDDFRKEAREDFDNFRKEAREDFDNFRKECLDEFIAFLKNPWKEFKEIPPEPKPKDEDIPPITIPEDELNKPIESRPIKIDDIIKPLPIQPQPTPIEPIEEVPRPADYVNFRFFGTDAKVRFDVANRIQLKGISEQQVADALRKVSLEDYDNMLIDCLALREQRQLSDWAYLMMLKALSEKIAGGTNNNATLTLAFLYMQSGYKMRLASDGNKLYMLFATNHHIYDLPAFVVGAHIYYAMDKDVPNPLMICEAAFPKEKELSLLIPYQQKFDLSSSEKRTITSKRYQDFSVDFTVNKNLIEFYDTYPTSMVDMNFITRWAMYANTPMDEYVQKQMYSTLKKNLTGLSQLEAAERLLNLVQTGFVYEYDNKVWGHDRAFFAEESLYYPYCDCEDRSILFTRLVRDLLGLKCILVYYPEHLAAAVAFKEGQVKGDYIMQDGNKYVITDPTYIGAPVGRTMPGMNNSSAKVIMLK